MYSCAANLLLKSGSNFSSQSSKSFLSTCHFFPVNVAISGYTFLAASKYSLASNCSLDKYLSRVVRSFHDLSAWPRNNNSDTRPVLSRLSRLRRSFSSIICLLNPLCMLLPWPKPPVDRSKCTTPRRSTSLRSHCG